MTIRNVLISLYEKRNLDLLVEGLYRQTVFPRFYATGGTYRHLKSLLGERAADGLVAVSDYSGHAELAGGLIKSLSYRLFLGILANPEDERHEAARQAATAVYFDLVVVNLYPFEYSSAHTAVRLDDPLAARNQIDIGGHALLRAAAKNWPRVAALCDPDDYEPFVTRLGDNRVDRHYRLALATKIFGYIARIDRTISDYHTTLQT